MSKKTVRDTKRGINELQRVKARDEFKRTPDGNACTFLSNPLLARVFI